MFHPLVSLDLSRLIVEDQGRFHESYNKAQTQLLDGEAGT
jgi:hypothetical protein